MIITSKLEPFEMPFGRREAFPVPRLGDAPAVNGVKAQAMLDLADKVEKSGTFDMMNWFGAKGEPGCVAGHMMEDHTTQEQRQMIRRYEGSADVLQGMVRSAMALLGLTEQMAQRLIFLREDAARALTAQQAASCLRYAAENGGTVDWNRAMKGTRWERENIHAV